jgi:hypothetical protein
LGPLVSKVEIVQRDSALDAKQKRQIEEIMAQMACEKDFACHKSDFENICKARDWGQPNYVDCMESTTAICRYKVPFGDGVFCSCPLRVYVAKKLKK